MNTSNQKLNNDVGKPLSPVPTNAPGLPLHPKLGNPFKTWAYRNASGDVLYYVCRFNLADGEKAYLPLSLWQSDDSTPAWCWKGLPEPRPLYGLDRLASSKEKAVLLCEGEKSADSGQEIFSDVVAITSSNGSNAADKADWLPLKDRNVLIWPDNDEPGRKYAQRAAQLILKAGAASVSVVSPPDTFPKGWDLADPLPEGFTKSDLERLMLDATPAKLPPDPLEGLVERAAQDPGEAFALDVVEALFALKMNDRAKFESLRKKLRDVKVRVSELDKIFKEKEGDESDDDGDDLNQADILIALAESAELFHTADEVAYAHFEVKDHRETWPVRHRGFKRWLTRRYLEEIGKAPSSEAINAALNAIEAKAYYDSPQQEAYLRVGRHGDDIYIDSCDSKWRVYKVTSAGWTIETSSPVRFRRTSGMLPLAVPKKGGSIELLRKFINVKGNDDFVLSISWLLAALRDTGPYPILGVSGEQGSAKSTFTLMMKKIVDPNTASLRALPTDDDALYIRANNGHLLAFDNLSFISPAIADTLCRLSTGGGHAKRQLYTDMDEILFNVMRPIILNGITDVVTRPDLADRTLILKLEAIPSENKRPEKELLAEFDAALPEILGALLDALSNGLRMLPQTRLESLPRMADYACWGTACEGAFQWPPGTFMSAYTANINSVIDSVLEASPVASAIISLIENRKCWNGTSTELLNICGEIVGEDITRLKIWPKTGRGMSEQLDRIATFLRQRNIKIERERSSDSRRDRIITLSRIDSNRSLVSSEPSEASGDPSPDSPKGRTEPDDPDGSRVALPEDEDPHRVKGFDEIYDPDGQPDPKDWMPGMPL